MNNSLMDTHKQLRLILRSLKTVHRSWEYTKRCKTSLLMFVRCTARTCRSLSVALYSVYVHYFEENWCDHKNACNKCETSCNVCKVLVCQLWKGAFKILFRFDNNVFKSSLLNCVTKRLTGTFTKKWVL